MIRLFEEARDELSALQSLKYYCSHPVLYDSIHIAQKLIRLARWGVKNSKSSSVEFRFPKTGSRLALLHAAASFREKKDTRNHASLLKSHLDVQLLAAPKLQGGPHVEVLESLGRVHMIHIEGTVKIDTNVVSRKVALSLIRSSDFDVEELKKAVEKYKVEGNVATV